MEAAPTDNTLIHLFDASGAVVQTIPRPLHIMRQSQRAPAEHRLMDKARAANPAIVAARIGTVKFEFQGGRSVWTGFVEG